MQGAVLHGPRDVRFEERTEPTIVDPTDAIIRLSATCICGSDLWPYRGANKVTDPTPMGHEYCGVVEEIGRGVRSIEKGQFVIGSFFASTTHVRTADLVTRRRVNTARPSSARRRRCCAFRLLMGLSWRRVTCLRPTTSRVCWRFQT